MQLFGGRPLCLICTVCILGILLGVVLPTIWVIAVGFALLLFCCFFLLLLYRGKVSFYRGSMVISMLLAFLLGTGASAFYYQGTVRSMAELRGEAIVEGVVVERRSGAGYYSSFLVDISTVNGSRESGRLLLTCGYPCDLQPGFSVCLRGELTPPDEVEQSLRTYYQSRGIVLYLSVEESDAVTILAEDDFSLSIYLAKMNRRLSARMRFALGEDSGSFLSALFLGNRDTLSPAVERDFRRLGLSHMLALSGMHLSILCAVVGGILSRIGIPRRFAAITRLVLITGYVLLTGVSVSVLRAALMLAFREGVTMCAEEADPVTSLFSAVTLICLCNPASVFDIGLWMSAFSTLGILLLNGWRLSFRLPVLLRITAFSSLITVVASLMTLPFLMLINGELSLLAIPANLLFGPLVNMLLLFAPLVLLFGRLSSVFSACISGVTGLILDAAEAAADWRGITVSLQYDFIPWILLPCLIIFAVMLVIRLPRRRLLWLPAAGFALLFLCGVFLSSDHDAVRAAWQIDRRNETLVLYSSAGALICDMTDGSYSPLAEAVGRAVEMGAPEIEVLMLTHYHTKHIGSLYRLCRDETLRQLWVPMPQSVREGEILLDLFDIAYAAGTAVSVYADGDAVEFGEAVLYAHTRDFLSRSAQPLIFLQISHAGEMMTYFGASLCEGPRYAALLESAAESDYLLLGGHGPNPKQSYMLADMPRLKWIAAASDAVRSFAALSDPTTAKQFLRVPVYLGGAPEILLGG